MSKTHKIYDWEDWVELCEEHHENPHEIADLSIPARRQISGGDTDDYIYCGLYPEEEDDPEPLVQYMSRYRAEEG